MGRLAAALASMALLCGCGSILPLGATDQADTIPWLPLAPDLTPAPAPSPETVPVPAGTPRCSASDLQGAVIGSNGAGGHVVTTFALATSGRVVCQLVGIPAVTLLDASGHTLPFANRAPFFPNDGRGYALVEPGPAPTFGLGLKYGQAGLTIDWVSQGEACPGDSALTVAQARIAISNISALTIDVPREPAGYACQGLGVGSFANVPLPPKAGPPPPTPPAPAIVVPPQVKAGTQLRYAAELTDDTKLPVDLREQCPNYEEELFADITHGSPPLGGKHIYRLNCKPAGVLEPGNAKKFAMVLAVPKDAIPGTYTLVFMIGYGNGMTRFTQRTIAIA